MKLRILILALAMMALFSAIIGSGLYFALLQETVVLDIRARASISVSSVSRTINAYWQENRNVVGILAGMPEIRMGLAKPLIDTVLDANRVLDQFQESVAVDVCYLMNHQGQVLATSNRYRSDSFLGKNYAFRPYFTVAMAGKPYVYMAVGVTSQKRGAYYSHPVYMAGRSEPAGVVVIKTAIDTLEKRINADLAALEGMWMLTNPQGVIFATNHTPWRYQLIHKTDARTLEQIGKSRQFGKGPHQWIGLEINDGNQAVNRDGNQYLLHTAAVANNPGWQVYLLTDPGHDLYMSQDPLMRFRTPALVGAVVFFTLMIFILYRMARVDMERRRQSQKLLRRQNEYMAALHDTALGLIGNLQYDQLMGVVLHRAGALVGTENGFLYHYDANRDELVLRVGLGLYKEEEGLRLKPGEGVAGTIYSTGKPLIIEDYATWPARVHNKKYNDLHYVMGMPLRGRQGIAGVIGLGHFKKGKSFSREQLEILERFAELVSLAMDNARLYSRLQSELTQRQQAEHAVRIANRKLKQLAVLDGLTHIANRRMFDNHLRQEWDRMVRAKQPLALLLCDVDFFKYFNDNHGHMAGDECLRALARTISANVHRPGDLVARYGGEEFGIILSSTSQSGALVVAEKIRKGVAALKIFHKASTVAPHVTISIGVASFVPQVHLNSDVLIKAADKSLYLAKARGRNCVVSASDIQKPPQPANEHDPDSMPAEVVIRKTRK